MPNAAKNSKPAGLKACMYIMCPDLGPLLTFYLIATKERRAALQEKVADYVQANPDIDLKKLFPVEIRGAPAAWTSPPLGHPPYYSFSQLLEVLQSDPMNPLSHRDMAKNSTDLPDHTLTPRFLKKIMKVVYFYKGTLGQEDVVRLLPGRSQGDGNSSTAELTAAKIKVASDETRSALISTNGTAILL